LKTSLQSQQYGMRYLPKSYEIAAKHRLVCQFFLDK